MSDGGFDIDRRVTSPAIGGPTTDDLPPGKRAPTSRLRPPTGVGPTGDAHIDTTTVCDVGGDPSSCFLSNISRTRLVGEYRDRVTAAAIVYTGALTDLRVDKLLEKEDDLSWVVSLLLGFLGAQLISGLSSALKALRGTGDKAASVMKLLGEGGGASERTRYLAAMSSLSDDTLKSVAKSISDGMRDAVKAKEQKIQNERQAGEKAEIVGYIDRLKDESSLMFQRLREMPPQFATDAQMIVLWESYDESHGHTASAYKAALSAKLERFRKSEARSVGIQPTAKHGVTNLGERHTQVAFVKMFDGRRRLAYLKQDFDASLAVRAERGNVTPEEVEATSPNDKPIDPEPMFVDFVEDELTEVALERHFAIWKRKPKTFYYDAKTSFPPRLREAGFSEVELAGEMSARGQRIKRATDMTLPGVGR